MEKKTIGQVCAVRTTDSQNLLFDEFRLEFEYLLNPEAGSLGKSGAAGFCLRDEAMSAPLNKLLSFPMNAIAAIIGSKGRGKTTIIKDVFGLINNEISVDEARGALIVPLFYQRWLPETSGSGESGKAEIVKNIVKTIRAACDALTASIPGLKEWSETDEAKLALFGFIRDTNPKALVDYENLHADSIVEKLDAAYREERFVYSASILKQLLGYEGVSAHRIILIVDGIESMSQELQDETIRQFLRLFRCLRNYPNSWKGPNVFINLLFFVRPETFSRVKKAGLFESYNSLTEFNRWDSFNLMAYFKTKVDVLSDSIRNNDEYKWKDALSILRVLCTKYDGKFAKMIMGLSGQDVRLALEMCRAILKSSWTTRDPFTERGESGQRYGFNNISIIRALSCNDRLVYMGDGDSYIPNVLENTETRDDAIIALYVMAYFVPKKKSEYGSIVYVKDQSLAEKRDNLVKDFVDVFGEEPDENGSLRERLTETVERLKTQGVVLDDYGTLSLTMKGMEIFFMFAQDSVLAEVYREARYRELKNDESMMSSNELMDGDSRNQGRVFNELLKDIQLFLENEKWFIDAASKRQAMSKYKNLFGTATMTGHLLSGIKCSLDFSGKINDFFGEWDRLNSEIQSRVEC